MENLDREDKYQRIYAVVDSIPKGSVATYGQVAREAGLPRNARMVGYALRNLPKGSKLPWHRVVNACGTISSRGNPASERLQARRLKAEGVTLRRGQVDLKTFAWEPVW
ncbi:MAG: methyltransferase [bacterium]|nr:methyltransferase [bacterium]